MTPELAELQEKVGHLAELIDRLSWEHQRTKAELFETKARHQRELSRLSEQIRSASNAHR